MKMTARFLIVAIVISCISFTGAVFADSPTTFDITSNASTVQTGDTFTVTVTGQNIKDLDAFEAHITFDSDKLDVVPGKIVANLKGGTINTQVNGNRITLAFAKMGNAATETGNISLCSVSFSVKKPGTPKVTLDSIKVLNGILAETDYTIGKTAVVSVNEPASLLITAKLDSVTKTATADVMAEDLKNAINSAADKIVNINVLGFEGAKTVLVNIPAQQISDAELKQGITININTGLATVSISPDLLKDCIGTSSVNLQLSVSTVDINTLPVDVKKQAGSNTVYDFSISVDGNRITKFNGNNKIADIEVGYSLKPGENPGKVIVYYIDSNDKLEVVKDGKYNSETGNVGFKPKHLSMFMLNYSAVTFSDLSSVNWAKDSIEALAGRGVISGMGGGKYMPNGQVTRAQFLTILMQAFDLADNSAVSTFKDVKKGEWYYSSVAAAQKYKIVSGKGDGSFGINDRITREDMAVMVYKAAILNNIILGGSTSKTQFTDKADISAYAADAVTAMQKSGLINGVGNGRFAPKDTATRAQAAVIIYNLFQKT